MSAASRSRASLGVLAQSALELGAGRGTEQRPLVDRGPQPEEHGLVGERPESVAGDLGREQVDRVRPDIDRSPDPRPIGHTPGAGSDSDSAGPPSGSRSREASTSRWTASSHPRLPMRVGLTQARKKRSPPPSVTPTASPRSPPGPWRWGVASVAAEAGLLADGVSTGFAGAGLGRAGVGRDRFGGGGRPSRFGDGALGGRFGRRRGGRLGGRRRRAYGARLRLVGGRAARLVADLPDDRRHGAGGRRLLLTLVDLLLHLGRLALALGPVARAFEILRQLRIRCRSSWATSRSHRRPRPRPRPRPRAPPRWWTAARWYGGSSVSAYRPSLAPGYGFGRVRKGRERYHRVRMAATGRSRRQR